MNVFLEYFLKIVSPSVTRHPVIRGRSATAATLLASDGLGWGGERALSNQCT
jgi:hypothetical protein